ncbi:MAG: hypothetical protein QOH83_2101 [Solirubrobacteraceae bacterium]|nr:hypothetical protein [Solirubrobacteraceae bacterium]
MSTNVIQPSLDAATLLTLWEEGVALPPAERALSLLCAAFPDAPVEDWAGASIGRRDEALLVLREALFGPTLEAAAGCPGCADELELSFRTDDVRSSAVARSEGLRIRLDGYDVLSRLPTSHDLLELAAVEQPSPQALLTRCVEVARRDGGDVGVDELPEAVVEEVVAGMARADPLADVQVAVVCPACGQRTAIAFDVLSYLWSEIDDWAQRLCLEVHALAGAYGWSERDIVTMSAQRRALYLELQGE